MSMLVKNGCCVVGGEPFFPIGLYSVPHASVFPRLRDAGFNLVQSYEFERSCYVNLQSEKCAKIEKEGLGDEAAAEYIDEANKWDLKVIMGFDRTYQLPHDNTKISQAQEENITRRVTLLKDKPALLGWYMIDEPDGQNISADKCRRVYDIVKKADSKHPTLIVLCESGAFEEYAADTADIIMRDRYPIPHSPIKVIAENFIKIRKQVPEEKPIWSVIQVFDWKNFLWEKESALPTYTQKRCMMYLPIIAGAKGTLFFAYDNEKQDIRRETDPKQWGEVATLAGELASLKPVLIQPFTAPQTCADGEIYCSRAEYNGSTYLFYANSGEKTLSEKIATDLTDLKKIEVLFEHRTIAPKEAGFYDEFEPYAVHVYKVDSE